MRKHLKSKKNVSCLIESHWINKKESIENVFGELHNILNNELMQFLKGDCEKQAKRDMFLKLMSRMMQSQSIQYATVSSMLT